MYGHQSVVVRSGQSSSEVAIDGHQSEVLGGEHVYRWISGFQWESLRRMVLRGHVKIEMTDDQRNSVHWDLDPLPPPQRNYLILIIRGLFYYAFIIPTYERIYM